MSAPSFTYSGNVYTAGTAGTVDFSLVSTTGNAIPYLEPSHVHVYKSANQGATWTELTRPSQWNFVTNGTVTRLATGISAGEWVKVQRITPSSSAYVTFQPSSLLTADQLNDDTLFNTYLNQELYDQGNQSAVIAAGAETAADAATTAANAATAAANTATTTANAASATAGTALSTANAASTNASAAVSTANTASTNASNAVTTANTASTNATTALSTANTASTNASAAVATANTASSNASSAVSTANSAASNASTALSQSNTALTQSSTALSQSSTALSQSSTALTNSSSAVSTANAANTNATAALNAVAAAVQYVLVANVAAIPAAPANGYAIEVVDSTGIESFSPVTNRPAGFVGDLGLSVRMQYSSTGSTWNWLGYYANNSESRYLKLSGGTLTGQLKADDSTSAAAPVYSFDGDTNTGVAHTGADELALVTGGNARLTIDGSGNVSVPGALTKGGSNVVTVGDAGTITSTMVADGTLVNDDISASAAIAGTKISPDFGSQNTTTTGASTAASFIPASSTVPTNGAYLPAANSVALATNSSERIRIGANGEIGLAGANYGTSGQVLTSAGSGAAPTWTTPSAGNTDKISEGNSSAEVIDTGSDGRFVVTTEGSERLRVDSSGRVGIGTSTVTWDTELARGSGVAAYFAARGNNNTAANAFVFGQDSSGLSRIFQDGNQPITFWTGSAATERARIDSSGRLLVGTSSVTNTAFTGSVQNIQVQGASQYASISVIGNKTTTEGAFVTLAKSRGTTAGSFTAVQSGDIPGAISFEGANGSAYLQAAEIRCTVEGTPSSTSMGGRLAFSTTANGASSPTERMRIDSAGRVGIGNTSPTFPLSITGAGSGSIQAQFTDATNSTCYIATPSSGVSAFGGNTGHHIAFGGFNTSASYAFTERARLDTSGRLLVGTSSSLGNYTFQVSGPTLLNGATIIPDAYSLVLNGITNYNQYSELQTYVAYNGVNPVISWYGGLGSKLTYNTAAQSLRPGTDGGVTLGAASLRFGQIYSTSGTISTSDQNAKQDIEPLSEKELRVAKVLKASIKKWKFKDAVIKKGSNARVHIGLIAQEARDAFINENLDPFAYGLLCRDEWWETKVETKNVDGSITFDTRIVPEGTEGATRCERYAVRYEELLAFIIAAL